ncbi:MAG: PAS domain S-box protein [Deltaproteobacteria bacterium]|nr:PAS domain S-box protein [Deltaproteobacteria bacterium]
MKNKKTRSPKGPEGGPAIGSPRGKSTGVKGPETSSGSRFTDERYRVFIENIQEGVYEVDIHGNFLYFNNSLCDVFGYPREEIQWQNFSKFMDEEHARAALDIFKNIYKTGKGISDLTWEILDKQGHTRIIELSANLIINQEGEHVGFRGIARDVTERVTAQRALQESEYRYQCQYEASRIAEKRYRTLLEFVPYPMVVFTTEGKVIYLNPAFTGTFGWTLDELQGRAIPYVPPEVEEETRESLKRLLEDRLVLNYQTKRLTKDGRVLDVVLSGTLFSEANEDEPSGELVILRDITQEKKIASTSEALIRIGMALPEYPDLQDLLDYISSEIKRLLNVAGAMVILLDEEKREFFFEGGAYDDTATKRRAREIRYPDDKGIAGKVLRSGEPVIVPDYSQDPDYYPIVDQKLGAHTRSLVDVPLRSSDDRIIGVLCAINKKEGTFDQTDVDLLSMIAGTVALSIENARFAKEVQEAYREVTSLNRAKDKVINHLSHELKTPVSVLMASLNILGKRMADIPEEAWQPTLERAKRNLARILAIQYEVEDIMESRHFKTYDLLNLLLDQCSDELESLVAEEVGEGPIVERIRKRIRDAYGPRESRVSEIFLDQFVTERLEALRPEFSQRDVEIITKMEPGAEICVPEDVIQKVVDGLIRNAVEATPDEGKIEIFVSKKGGGTELAVWDRGIGITEDDQRRIFEGFFTTQDTMAYSSKRPFDFNAGGKGADLLRMKIFAERFHFRIEMRSTRCGFIPKETDVCPGRISDCSFCSTQADCFDSGGTAFTVFFPPESAEVCRPGAAPERSP